MGGDGGGKILLGAGAVCLRVPPSMLECPVEPAILPLTCIYVERYCQFFSHLNIELLNLVCAKNIDTFYVDIDCGLQSHILVISIRFRLRDSASGLEP